MLQRGMKCSHLPLWSQPSGVASADGTGQDDCSAWSPRVSKTCCCFGKGWDVRKGAQGCPSPPALLQGSQDSAALEGPCESPERGLLSSYLEFCLKLVAIWPLSKMMNILGAGRERLRGSGKQRGEGKGNSRLRVPPARG